MRKITFLLLSLLFIGAQAQRTITGTVVDADEKQGIPGVQVMVKGTTVGTTTNVMGQYSLNVPTDATTLVYRFMGMETQEIEIGSRTTIDVVMGGDAVSLDEVVITGYGVKRKAAFTGSAGRVDEGALQQRGEANVVNSLQGQMSGVQISASQGKAGSANTMRIRGLGSINASRGPLYIVDGVPIVTGGIGISEQGMVDPLSTINSNDIESITVLKDATATAIYGSRASNGVVVITTKKGSVKKSDIAVTFQKGVTAPPKLTHQNQNLNAEDFTTLMLEGIMNSRGWDWNEPSNWEAARTLLMLNTAVNNPGVDTDWWDEVTRPGAYTNFDVSFSGGDEKTTFFASGGFYQDDGYVIAQDFKRYSGRLNVEHKANKIITLGMNLSGGYTNRNDVSGGYAYSAPLFSSRLLLPTAPVKNEDGTWNVDAGRANVNPVGEWTDELGSFDNLKQVKTTVIPYLRFNLMENLFFQTRLGVDWTNTDNRQFKTPARIGNVDYTRGGSIVEEITNYYAITLVNTLNYLKKFGKSNINVLLGQEAQTNRSHSAWTRKINFSSAFFNELASAAKPDASSGQTIESTIASYFSNVEYDFDNKYYLSASFRRDGSSRFDENKWGNFFSVGGRWRFSEEAFMKNKALSFVNSAALRTSYGTTGNQSGIAAYASQGLFASGNNYLQIAGSAPAQIAIPDLTWEKKKKFNVGLDAVLFDRLQFEVDYYNELTTDLLLSVPVPAATGFTTKMSNYGSMLNSGVEFNINAQIIKTKDFSWNIGFNITKNKNVVKKLYQDNLQGTLTQVTVGRSYSSFFMPLWAGVDPANGNPLWYTDGTKSATTSNYNEAEKTWAGTYEPDFYGGFNSRIAYKGFELSAMFSYTVGGYIFGNDGIRSENDGDRSNGLENRSYYRFDNRWTPNNPNGTTPSYVWSDTRNGSANSTRFLVPADFLRLKQLRLSYTFPKKYIEKLKLSKANIFVTGDNIWTKTKKDFRGYDPEAGLGSQQSANFPIPRKFSIGASIMF